MLQLQHIFAILSKYFLILKDKTICMRLYSVDIILQVIILAHSHQIVISWTRKLWYHQNYRQITRQNAGDRNIQGKYPIGFCLYSDYKRTLR